MHNGDEFFEITLGSSDSSYASTINSNTPIRSLRILSQGIGQYTDHDIATLTQTYKKSGLDLVHNTQNADILKSVIEHAKSDDTLLKTKDSDGNTVLHKACRNGRADLAELLIMAKPELNNETNTKGETPLHTAITNNQEAIVHMLTAQTPPLFEKQDSDGNTPLHLCCKSSNDNIASLVMQNLNDLKPERLLVKNNDDKNPLEIACTHGNLIAIDKLLETKHYNINKLDPTYNVLQLAILNNQALAADLLLAKGANVDLKDLNGDTPLHLACKQRNIACTSVLLNCGANIKLRNKAGFTALQLACQLGDVDIVDQLTNKAKKDSGLDILTTPADLRLNKSPIHIAIENKHTDVFNKLINWYDFNTAELNEDFGKICAMITLKDWCSDKRKSPLELAYEKKQDQVIKSLLTNSHFKGLFKAITRKDKFGYIKAIIDKNKDEPFFGYNNFDDFIKAELADLNKMITDFGESNLSTNLKSLHTQLSKEFESKSMSRKVKVAKLVFESQAFIENLNLGIPAELKKPFVAQFMKNSKRACFSQTIWDLIKTIAIIALAALLCATLATYASFAMAYPLIITTPISTVLSHVPLATTLYGAGFGAAGGLAISLLSFFHVNWSVNNISHNATSSINEALKPEKNL